MPSVIRVAPASRAPRKMPGNASTLLIWLGKSLRPVATTAAYRAATSGCTSGVGFARAKTIAPVAMPATAASPIVPAGDADEHVGAAQGVVDAAGEARGLVQRRRAPP